MLAHLRWCVECARCRCGASCCDQPCECPASVRSFGVTAAGTNPADSDDEERGNVPRTLAEQVGALAPFLVCAADDLTIHVVESVSLAAQRIVEGFNVYGSELFTMPDDELAQNLAEEFADAIVYRSEQLRREADAS